MLIKIRYLDETTDPEIYEVYGSIYLGKGDQIGIFNIPEQTEVCGKNEWRDNHYEYELLDKKENISTDHFYKNDNYYVLYWKEIEVK